jgi:hypothetical protein
MEYTDILEYLGRIPSYTHGASEQSNVLGMKKRQLVLNEDEDVETFLNNFKSEVTPPAVTEDDDDYSPEVLELEDDMEVVGSSEGWDNVNDLIKSYRDSQI